MTLRSQQLIETLKLEPHIEGGYFCRSFTARATTGGKSERPLASCIYYLLNRQSPIGHFHRNRSDIIHFFHEGKYYKLVLGPKLEQGEKPHLVVPGGYWKASELLDTEEYGLISETVVPAFDYADMELASTELFQQHYPELYPGVKHLIKASNR